MTARRNPFDELGDIDFTDDSGSLEALHDRIVDLTADLAAATRRAEIAEAALSRYVSVGWWSEGNGFTPSGLAAGREPETASATRFMKRRGDRRVYIIRNALAARTDTEAGK